MSNNKLTDLLAGIQSAVADTMQQIEMQHTNMLKKYFDIDESGNHITAKTVAVEIPARNQLKSATEIINVPLVSLVPIRSLKIDEIMLEFEARISAINIAEDEKKSKNIKINEGLGTGYQLSNKIAPEIMIEMKKPSFGSSTTPIKISIRFKDSDPPEGIVRVSEHILNQIK